LYPIVTLRDLDFAQSLNSAPAYHHHLASLLLIIETGDAMSDTLRDLARENGISFIVTVGGSDRKCIITHDALKSLCPPDDEEMQSKAIFWEYEDRIYRVARRLVNAGERDNPLILDPRYFS
jgi:hypothetical protein